MKIHPLTKPVIIMLSIAFALTILDLFIPRNNAKIFFIIEAILLIPTFWMNCLWNKDDEPKR